MGMLELLTGAGLSAAAGLNAYIPLLLVGLGARFFDWVQLPPAWAWLSNEWVLVILGVLFVIEIVADKIPAVDTVNDWIQTIVRPTAGGILFGTGTSSSTTAVTDPAEFFASNQWVPIVIGIVLSLAGLLVPIPLMALDLLTGAVQAYIFAVLAMVFIGAAVGETPHPADNNQKEHA